MDTLICLFREHKYKELIIFISESPCLLTAFICDSTTLLHELCILNNYVLILKLIKYCTHIDVKDKKGYTPLMLSLLYQNFETYTILLDNNADPSIKDDTPFKLDVHARAFMTQDVRFSERIKNCSQYTLYNNLNLLSVCVKINDFFSVDKYLSKNYDINVLNGDGSTALFHCQTVKMAKLLIMNGCNINIINSLNKSAQQHHREMHNLDIVNFLSCLSNEE